jgi:hypothetical protein
MGRADWRVIRRLHRKGLLTYANDEVRASQNCRIFASDSVRPLRDRHRRHTAHLSGPRVSVALRAPDPLALLRARHPRRQGDRVAGALLHCLGDSGNRGEPAACQP